MFIKVYFYLFLCWVEGGDCENCLDVVVLGKKVLKKIGMV